jgi:HlyD family secretion protein
VTRKYLTLLAAVALSVDCAGKQEETLTIRTAPVERRTIVVQAEATGVIEPINVVEVKSRSSGQVTEMPVETGSLVRPGDLIVQLDTRDVQNQYDQAKADLDAA